MRLSLSRFLILGVWLGVLSSVAAAQETVLAIQDFEDTPQTPVWGFTGTFDRLSGNSSASAAPPNSPLGIGGSQAWHTVQISAGNPVTFDNVMIPAGFDTVVARFRLAAMNLNATSGGPDNLDFVLVEVSLDGGTVFNNRIRIRGATNNNSFWPYSATGVAAVVYDPAANPQPETLFQPITTGLQDEFGYSTVEIEFPGAVSQISLRITPRSSSSSDSWLIDDLVLLGVASSEADLSLDKQVNLTTAVVGDSLDYTIQVDNAGPGDVASATVSDVFPAECIAVDWTCVAANGASCSAAGSGSINDDVSLPAGSGLTYTAVCETGSDAVGEVINTASVSSAVADPDQSNNSDNTSTTLLTPGELLINPAAVDFGSIGTGADSAVETVTLSNIGQGELQVESISPASSPFALVGGTCAAAPFALAGGADCTLEYQFAPTLPGAAAGMVDIAWSERSNNAELNLSLQGEGLAGSLVISAAVLDFGDPITGAATTELTVELSNPGPGQVEVTQLDSPQPPFLRTGSSCEAVPFVLQNGQACSITYVMQTAVPGDYNQILTLLAQGASFSIELSGSVQAPLVVPIFSPIGLLVLIVLSVLLAVRYRYKAIIRT